MIGFLGGQGDDIYGGIYVSATLEVPAGVAGEFNFNVVGHCAMRTVALVGLGHTNAEVVRQWMLSPIGGTRLVCISDFPEATYSGMLPAVLAGEVPEEAMRIPLGALVEAAGGELRIGSLTGLDLDNRLLYLEGGERIACDVLSIGVGSVVGEGAVEEHQPGETHAGDGLVTRLKPMQTLMARIRDAWRRLAGSGADQWVRRRDESQRLELSVVGGGASALELICSLQKYWERETGGLHARWTLFTADERLGTGLNERTTRALTGHLRARGIRVVTGTRVVRVLDGELEDSRGRRFASDWAIFATGATAPKMLSELGLPQDERGFLRRQSTLQTVGVPWVFAVGDCGTLDGGRGAKAGVNAVRQGPVLWHNLNALLRGGELINFEPRRRFLRLLNTADGRAVLEYGAWSLHARWCRWLKTLIDGRFVARYRSPF